MRRDVRKRNNQSDDLNMKIIKYSGIGVAVLAVIVFGILIYTKSMDDGVEEGTLTSEQISNMWGSTEYSDDTESASSEIGKKVDELEVEIKDNATVTNNTTNTTDSKSNTTSNSKNNTAKTNSNVLTTNNVKPTDTTTETSSNASTTEDKKEEEKTVELSFERPVEGDVVKDFAVDSLVYSETLKEWTTHTGIDIKAEKTTVVKSAEAGTVKTIKNDPRYGLTIIVEHANGFQTVYSNLLTSEFVVEGEKVEKGQSLGTVGNAAAFEIADEPHLHFEILKDGVQVDPNIHLK